MLKNMLELAKDAVNKSSIIFKALLEKILEFFLSHLMLDLRITLLLVLLLDHHFTEKQSDKKDLIWPISPSG